MARSRRDGSPELEVLPADAEASQIIALDRPSRSAPTVPADGLSRAAATTPTGPMSAVGPASGAHLARAAPRETPRPLFNRALEARRLAASVDAAISRFGASTVLITSPAGPTGKSFMASMIAPEMEKISPEKYLVLAQDALADFDPDVRAEGLVVIVDGPAMLSGDGALSVPDRWMRAFDASILVVMGRRTRVSDLDEALAWLRDAGIPPIGILFNEHECPDPRTRLRLWLRYLVGGGLRADIRDAWRSRARSSRGSS